MPWDPLAEWGPLDSDFDELSPPSNLLARKTWFQQSQIYQPICTNLICTNLICTNLICTNLICTKPHFYHPLKRGVLCEPRDISIVNSR